MDRNNRVDNAQQQEISAKRSRAQGLFLLTFVCG
jgi:hypothetical protein